MKFISITSHAGELYALADSGDIYKHARNPRYVAGPNADQPAFIWQKMPLPAGFEDQPVFDAKKGE